MLLVNVSDWPRPDGGDPERERLRPVAAVQTHLLGLAGVVVGDDLVGDRRVAGRARQQRADLRRAEIDLVDGAQVDVAQDAAVVPPAAERRPGHRQARRREVVAVAAVVDAHDDPVRLAGVQLPRREDELERQVGAAVAPDHVAVEPHRRLVVDRLEAGDPGRRLRRAGQPEVLAIPGDTAAERLRARVQRVPRLGDRDLGPAVDPRVVLVVGGDPDVAGVVAPQPCPVEQVAARRAVAVVGLERRRLGRVAGAGLRRAARAGRGHGSGDDGDRRQARGQGLLSDRDGGEHSSCQSRQHERVLDHGPAHATSESMGSGPVVRHQQSPVRAIGAEMVRRCTWRPSSAFPVRCTSTH